MFAFFCSAEAIVGLLEVGPGVDSTETSVPLDPVANLERHKLHSRWSFYLTDAHVDLLENGPGVDSTERQRELTCARSLLKSTLAPSPPETAVTH